MLLKYSPLITWHMEALKLVILLKRKERVRMRDRIRSQAPSSNCLAKLQEVQSHVKPESRPVSIISV